MGRHLVEALLARGWETAVLTRDPARARTLRARGASVVPGDIRKPRFQTEASKADVLFHAAGWFELGVREGRLMFDVNVTGTANVLAIARKENVPRVVFTGTAGVYAPAPRNRPATETSSAAAALDDPYVTTKVQAHNLAVGEMHAGLPVTIVAPAAVFGPGDTNDLGRSLALLAQGRLRMFPKGFGVNTWTHAADVAEGHVLAATRGRIGEIYLVADRVLGFEEFFEKAAEAAGVKPPRWRVPRALARLGARTSEATARLRDRRPTVTRASLALGALDLAVDSRKARTDLGWSPQPLEDRLRQTMAWYVETYRTGRAPLPVKPSDASAEGPPRKA